MKNNFWLNCIAYFFILLFIYTGAAKLLDIHLFQEQLNSSPLLGFMAGIITWALPIGEILIAIGLFFPAWQLKAMYATFVLMLLFTLYVTTILFMDNHISCSCGGIVEDLSPKQHIIFNSACLILSLIGISIARRKQPATRVKWLTGASTISLLMVVGWILFSAFSAPASVKTGFEGRMLPSFQVLLTDSTTYLNTADIPTGKPFVVIGFSPICKHCGAETADIIKHIEEFKDIHIYYVTPFPIPQINGFYGYFKLANYPNISMGRDGQDYFLTYFKAAGVPFTAVFDSKKRLKQVFASQVDASQLLQALKQ